MRATRRPARPRIHVVSEPQPDGICHVRWDLDPDCWSPATSPGWRELEQRRHPRVVQHHEHLAAAGATSWTVFASPLAARFTAERPTFAALLDGPPAAPSWALATADPKIGPSAPRAPSPRLPDPAGRWPVTA